MRRNRCKKVDCTAGRLITAPTDRNWIGKNGQNRPKKGLVRFCILHNRRGANRIKWKVVVYPFVGGYYINDHKEWNEMYSNSKLSKRTISFALALFLVLNLVLVPGLFPATVFAEGEEPTGTTQVLYVDGKGSGDKDGRSKENALAYVSEAYAEIPNDNIKTTIVICGSVDMAKDPGLVKFTDTYNTEYTYYKRGENALMHSGEVVFTSNGSGSLTLPTRLALTGNTTFENIKIGNRAYQMYGNYFTLRIGEGVDVSNWANLFADTLYLGTNASLFAHFDATSEKIKVRDVEFTMESGAINKLYGGGSSDQGWSNRQIAYNLEMNLMGGTVNNLYIASNGYNSDGHTPVSDATVTIGGAAVGELTKKTGNGTITGAVKLVLDLQGKDVAMTVGSGLELDIIDTANTKKDGTAAGKASVTGTVNTVSQDPNTQMRYLAVYDENTQTYSAHPFNLSIVQYGLDTIHGEIALRVVMMANDDVAQKIDSYGVYSVTSQVPYSIGDSFEGNYVNVCVNLLESLSAENIDKTVTYSAYMSIDGKEYRSATEVKITPSLILTQIVAGIQNGTIGLNDGQEARIKALMETNTRVNEIFADCFN